MAVRHDASRFQYARPLRRFLYRAGQREDDTGDNSSRRVRLARTLHRISSSISPGICPCGYRRCSSLCATITQEANDYAAEKRRGIKKLEASLKGRDADKPAIKAAILEAKRGFDSPEAWVQKLRDNMLTDPLKAVNDDILAAHATQHSLDHTESPQSHPGPTKDRLTEKGLEFHQTKTFESYLYRNTKLAAFLAEVEPSYCLIKAPAHAMASVRKDGTLSFFDPNFGEVSFDDPEKFQEFVKTFFNNERVQRNYKGDGQTKILFVVDRYK